MRTSFRIHPVIIPGEIYSLRFVNTGVEGKFLFLGAQKCFCIFKDAKGELTRARYEDVRWARG